MKNIFRIKIFRCLAAALGLAAAAAGGAQDMTGEVQIRTNLTLNSRTSHAGDTWDGSVAADVVREGVVVLRRGTPAEGVVTEARSAGRGADAVLTLKLVSINGQPVVSEPHVMAGEVTEKKASRTMTGWALSGALVGGILHGGKGALAGAATGAGIGAIRAGAKERHEVNLAVETIVVFRMTGAPGR